MSTEKQALEKEMSNISICSSYNYNFNSERAYCYFWERYLTEEDECPCEYYDYVDGSLEESYDNPLTESIFEDDEDSL